VFNLKDQVQVNTIFDPDTEKVDLLGSILKKEESLIVFQ
jgi:hypothetical protein